MPELLTDPTFAFWAAFAVPFLVRWFVAWTVELRVRGWAPSANLEPRRQRSDYPAPNDPVRALVVALAAVTIAWPLAVIVTGLAPVVGAEMALAAFVVSAAWSVIYAIRRMFQDDRRTRELLAERLLSESQVGPLRPDGLVEKDGTSVHGTGH